MIKRLLIALAALLVIIPVVGWLQLNSRARAAVEKVVAEVQTAEKQPRTRPSHAVPPAAENFEACVSPLFKARATEKTPDACSKWFKDGSADRLPPECATWSTSLGDWPTQVMQCSRGSDSPHPGFWTEQATVLPVTAVNAFVLKATAGEVTLEHCADAVAFARDRHRGSAALGLAVSVAMLKRLVPACVKVLDSAPTADKWKFAQAMDTVLETLPYLSQDVRDEGVFFGLMLAALFDAELPGKLPERWRKTLEGPGGEAALLQPLLVRNALIESQQAFTRAWVAADFPAVDRDRGLAAAFAPLKDHWNPLLLDHDSSRWAQWHDDERALVLLLSRAAMLDAMGPQDRAPDLSKVKSALKIEQKSGQWVLSAAGLEVLLHAESAAVSTP